MGDKTMTLHHRRCVSNLGSDEPSNLIMLPVTQHQAWHTLTQNMHPKDIAKLFSEKFIDPDYLFICVKKRW